MIPYMSVPTYSQVSIPYAGTLSMPTGTLSFDNFDPLFPPLIPCRSGSGAGAVVAGHRRVPGGAAAGQAGQGR